METILGVRGDLLCGVGAKATCYDISRGRLHWSAPLPEGSDLFGRGVWVDDRLLVPTRESLSSFSVADGQRRTLSWPADVGGGNIVGLPDQLLVAGGEAIAAYVSKTEIWTSLRQRLIAEPEDPGPALEFAEVALRGGEYADALAMLDEAVRRTGNLVEPADPVLQKQLFEDVLAFVDTLAARGLLEPDLLERLFGYASQSSPDAQGHLVLRSRFGQLFQERDQSERAVGLYQQVLRDRSLRELPAPGEEIEAESAGAWAAVQIERLIKREGPSVYAPFEAEAGGWLQSARVAKDEALLARVAETFPNSNAAPQALIARADLLMTSERAAEAATLFARAYHRYLSRVNRPALVRKIADAYEQAGKLTHAYRWLTKGTREHPTVLFEHAGRSVTFREYRERLAEVRSQVEPSPPRINLPLAGGYIRTFEGSISLLTPRFADDPACIWTRYFIDTDEGILAFDARTGTEVWDRPAPVRAHPDLLLATSELAVFSTLYEVFAVDATTGRRNWAYGEYPEHLEDDLADWEDGEALRAHAVQGNHLVSARGNGELTCVNFRNGKQAWSRMHRPLPAGGLRLADPWVVYHAMEDGRAVLVLIDAASGAEVKTIPLDESGSVAEIFVALDGQIVVVTSRSITSYDGETGARRWRVHLDAHLRRASLLLDLEALYFSDDGQQLRKISLEDGRSLWQSESLVRRGEEDLTVWRRGGSIILSTMSSVSAVDEVTGLTLWRGTTPERVRLVSRFLTESYVAAIDLPDEGRETGGTLYFYDHRNASGIIPREGGTCDLGFLSEVRAIMAVDGAVLVQTGTTLQGWTE